MQLVTNGSNLQGLWRFAISFGEPVIEENDTKTNDIHAALITYGVEMARAIILNEIRGVFGAYNIDVDMRHLELIADYMVSRKMVYSNCLDDSFRRTMVVTNHSIARAFQRILHHC